ncbi:MAG: molecular chaperone GrpE [Halobacteriales archaeon]|jgi:molecular chaperone GrpE
MADNEGTDSSVETEANDDVADPAEGDVDEDDASEAADQGGDGAEAETGAEGSSTAEVVSAKEQADAETEGVIENEQELIQRVTDHDEDLGEAVSELVDWTLELQDRRAELESEIGDLESEIEDLETSIEEKDTEIDDLTSQLKRKQADFQNYKKRTEKRQEQIKDRATEDLVERLVDVRNDLVRAIESDHEDLESLREGVEMTLREFDHVLDAENVEEIAPDPGEELDPQRHEVMMQVDSSRPEGAIHDVFDSGYEMAGKVLQPARVTVSNGADHDPDTDEESDHVEADSADDDDTDSAAEAENGDREGDAEGSADDADDATTDEEVEDPELDEPPDREADDSSS